MSMGQVWIGMAEVSIGSNCKLDLSGAGAFVWCATQAEDELMFARKVESMLEHYGLFALEISDVRRVEESAEISEDFVEIVSRAEENPEFTVYGTFHTFDRHNA